MDTQRLVLFIVFSFSLLLLWQAWEKGQHPPVAQTAAVKAGVETRAAAPTAPADASPVLKSGERIRVKTDLVNAELDTVGGDLRKLEFLRHRDTVDNSRQLQLFDDEPGKTYLTQSGFINSALPTHKAQYRASAAEYALAPGSDKLEVRLNWEGDGLQVEKIYTFHRGSYVIDIAYVVRNGGAAALKPDAYFQTLRHGQPPAGDPKFIQTFTGPAVYTDREKFRKIQFSDIDKGKENLGGKSRDGWIAMLQHYFLSAWLPIGDVEREFYAKQLAGGLYSTGVIVPAGTIEPGGSATVSMKLYAGPQEQDKLAALAPGLDLTVDYGWLTVIASPLFWVLSAINKLVGNWGVAIILLTVLLKLAFYPLSAKSYRSMAQMRVVGPKLQRLKEQFGDDREKLHQAMMELYKTEKINPLGGCLPVVVQIPVFIALYWVLLAAVELRQAPFALWIHDLSTPDPFYVLPIVMGITMVIQAKLNPTPPDPIQAKVMLYMPIGFAVFFFFFPAGLVLYWLVNNILSILQQWQINRAIEGAPSGHAKR